MSSTAQFEMAVDVSKQLLTLATAIVTVTITFSKDIVGVNDVSPGDQLLAGWAWGVFLVSILGGIWCLYALLGSTSKVERGESATVYDWNIAIPMAIQQLSFVGAMVLTIIFGVRVL